MRETEIITEKKGESTWDFIQNKLLFKFLINIPKKIGDSTFMKQ